MNEFHSAIHTCFRLYIRYWPIDKGKQRLVNTLWEKFSFGNYQRQVTLRGYNAKMHCDLTQYVQRHIYFWGSYEPMECRFWFARAKAAKVVFDVGANVGIYTLLAALANPKCTIHAFEPTPDVVAALRANVQLNNLQNVCVNALGIGCKNEVAYLSVSRGSSQDNEGMNFVTYVADNEVDIQIHLTSLDSYCEKYQIEHIDLLKLDIEGGEYAALEGANNLLKQQKIGCIMFEAVDWTLARNGYDIEQLCQLLNKAGYAIYELQHDQLKVVSQDALPKNQNLIAIPFPN